ncbi:MAG: HNH endonuclease [Candidatus Methanomethylophilus sp.]|jgi:hypothetical protein|nr:HNH endonuclease [Methanomethylophilus sp.]MCI2092517.1 HNH endonuclease [Methanomethylophilus sp.]
MTGTALSREAVGKLLPIYIPKKDPEKAAERERIRDEMAERLLQELLPAEDGSLWLERGTDEPVPGSDYFGSYWWPAVRRCVLMRDGGRCTACGSAGALEVHHILPRRKGGADSPRNLRTLCRACHEKAHRSRAAEDAAADIYQTRLEGWA